MLHNWCIHPSVIDSKEIDKLIEFVENNYTLETGLINHFGDQTKHEHRECDITWIGNKPEDSFLRNLTWDCFTNSNREAFGFDIQYNGPIQYTVYREENAGHYNWHRDTYFTGPRCYDRKLTLIIQLSDSDEYEGGDLYIEKDFNADAIDRNQLRQKGTIFIFPSFINHKVTPVTKGIRRSLVAWAEGPKFR